jgi:hypothetical protein
MPDELASKGTAAIAVRGSALAMLKLPRYQALEPSWAFSMSAREGLW